MNTKFHIAKDFELTVSVAKHAKSEQLIDARLCEWSMVLMNEKLDEARSKGRHGWYDNEVCTIKDLKEMLSQAVDKGDMTDVMNFAAMINIRECAEAARK